MNAHMLYLEWKAIAMHLAEQVGEGSGLDPEEVLDGAIETVGATNVQEEEWHH